MAKIEATIRLGVEGGTDVKTEFGAVATAAELSADRQVKAYDRAAASAARSEARKEAIRRKAEEAIAAVESRKTELRQQAEALFASPSIASQPAIPPAPSVPQAAAKGLDDILQQRKYQAAAEALKDAVDPAGRAQREFNAEVAIAQELLSRTLIDESQYAARMQQLEQALARATGAEREQQLALAERQRAEQEALAAQQRYQAGLDTLLDRLEPARIAQRALNAELDEARKYYEAGALSEEQYAAARAQAQQRHDIATGVIDPAAARKAAEELRQYAAEANQVRSAIDPLFIAQTRYNEAIAQADRLLARNAITEAEHALYVNKVTAALDEERLALERNGVSAGQARFGARDLGYQLQDLGVQFSMAAQSSEPFKMLMLTITQQGPQVVQAIGMMKGEATGFLGFLTGPWGMGVMAAVSVLGSLALAHTTAAGAESKHKTAAEELSKAIDDLHDATERQTRSTQASIQVDLDKANALRQQAQEARKAAVAELKLTQQRMDADAAKGVGGRQANLGLGGAAYEDASRYKVLSDQIKELDGQIAASDETIRLKRGQIVQQQVREHFDAAAAAAGKYQRTLDALNDSLEKGTITEDAYRAAVGRAMQTQISEEKAAREAAKHPRKPKKKKAEPSYWTQFFDEYTAARKDVIAQLAQQAKDDQARIMAARVRDGEPQHAALSDFSGRALEYQRAMALADAERSGDQDRIRRQLLLNELDQRNIDLTDEQIGQVLEWRKEEEEAAKQADRHRQAWQQLREDGAQALDTLLNPDNITHWGDTFRQVLRQVLFDLEKLTLINPLENLLFGGNRATLGGAKSGGGGLGGLLTSVLGGLFGKASPQASLASSATATIAANPGLFADGTQSAPGGWAVVGERGRELVKLPRGAGVLTASRTRAALAESGGGQPVHVSLTLDARGAGPREVEALQAQVDRLRREFPAIAVQAVASARQRRVIA